MLKASQGSAYSTLCTISYYIIYYTTIHGNTKS